MKMKSEEFAIAIVQGCNSSLFYKVRIKDERCNIGPARRDDI